MGRLKEQFLTRIEDFCDRVLDMSEVLETNRRAARHVDQIARSATSIGANAFEADEALSRKDFCKTLDISLKELNETRYWVRTVSRRQWIKASRVSSLLDEGRQLRAVIGAMIAKSKSATSS